MNKKLKAKIIEASGSQFAFAQSVGCREAAVSEVIRGRRCLTPEQVVLWSKALGCDVMSLVNTAARYI